MWLPIKNYLVSIYTELKVAFCLTCKFAPLLKRRRMHLGQEPFFILSY
jgi:hypothetical protein